MKQGRGIKWVLFLSFVLLAAFGGGCGGGGGGHSSSSGTTTTVSADEAIERVSTIAFVDHDGPKVQAIVVKYKYNLSGDSVTKDAYDVTNHAKTLAANAFQAFVGQTSTPGVPTKAYVSKTGKIDPTGQGDSSGEYVVIELDTAYRTSFAGNGGNQGAGYWRQRLIGGVTQLVTLTGDNVIVTPGAEEKGNYETAYIPVESGNNPHIARTQVIDDDLYTLEDLDVYDIYTDVNEPALPDQTLVVNKNTPPATEVGTLAPSTRGKRVVGPAFRADCHNAQGCFSEYTGAYAGVVPVTYSLFAPEECKKGSAKKCGLVLHFEDAGVLGSDPMIAQTETSVAKNYATIGQDIAKAQGLAGLVVVLPQVREAQRSVNDNLIGGELVPAVWHLLDDLAGNTALGVEGRYNIDTKRIYGSGQSMGGMSVLYMAAMRDQYFAGIWSIGSQWGSSYNKDQYYSSNFGTYSSAQSYPTDGKIITNPDWQNWAWSVSDDNILIGPSNDGKANAYWDQLSKLYEEIAGYVIPTTHWFSKTETIAQQNNKMQALTSTPQSKNMGMYRYVLDDVGHMDGWVYAHAIDYSYEWLLSQTNSTGNTARKKLYAASALYVDNSLGNTPGLGTYGTKCFNSGYTLSSIINSNPTSNNSMKTGLAAGCP